MAPPAINSTVGPERPTRSQCRHRGSMPAQGCVRRGPLEQVEGRSRGIVSGPGLLAPELVHFDDARQLALDVIHEALERAGVAAPSLKRTSTG